MAIKKKNKETKKHKVEEIKGSYKFNYIKFNFSFLSTNSKYNFNNNKMSDLHKAELINRILFWSSCSIIYLSQLPKDKGYETIAEEMIAITASPNNKFYEDAERVQACSDKYYVFRLYPNNNPIAIRLIGKWANGVFYLFFIDMDHKYV
ncbi:hypothetical protein SAMN04487885_106108 [Clostridium cadaveris]|uniref:Uncharacterized protein n=1 Tax=Clostridium cadaveris TaxID=1529 RepID=A0A1I2KLX3_9CLOT|nr:hypothetical protein [Clostridium cadaveris]SFF67965.1 hypothetical protein SAMN04487885_106108 [Clostridium cadaveris]